jgi:hypothetical protein
MVLCLLSNDFARVVEGSNRGLIWRTRQTEENHGERRSGHAEDNGWPFCNLFWFRIFSLPVGHFVQLHLNPSKCSYLPSPQLWGLKEVDEDSSSRPNPPPPRTHAHAHTQIGEWTFLSILVSIVSRKCVLRVFVYDLKALLWFGGPAKLLGIMVS